MSKGGTKSHHQVLIAGGGPTGLMLAGELALAGIDVAIIERRDNQDLAGMRAGGLHMRTIEVLDQRGIGDRFVALGQAHYVAPFYDTMLDVSDFPTRRNYFIALPQNQTERLLAEWVGELGVHIYRGSEVVGFDQNEESVIVKRVEGQTLSADFLVGCDGARSIIRKCACIEFAGWEPTKSWLIAEAQWSEQPEWGVRHDNCGSHALGKMERAEQVRIVLSEPVLEDGSQPDFDEVKSALLSIYGTDFGIHSPTWISRFTDRCRQAVAYRDRRILLAGDAAHIHPPMGGQGLNIGVQDAVNLGWKLAQVIKGTSPDGLLDTYHTERHPVASRVLLNTMADVALQRRDERTQALVRIMAELAAMDGPRKHLIAERSGLGVCYSLGSGHPLIGRRLPDLDVETSVGQIRTYDLLKAARPVLFNFGAPLAHDFGLWRDRVDLVEARYKGVWELPVLGAVESPTAVLVRPDGYVAWVGLQDDGGLLDALTTWFGAPECSVREPGLDRPFVRPLPEI